MNIAETVHEEVQALPIDKQREVLNFVEFLRSRTVIKKPRKSLYGLCADLNVNVTEEDITEIRKEMWANFPRENF